MLCAGTVIQFSIGTVVIGLDALDTPEIGLLKSKGVEVVFHPHDGCAGLSGER